MAMYYNGKKVRNLYFNGKCITRLALGKEMTRLVEGDDFVRKDWLIGDGVAYIDTNVKNITGDLITFKFDGSENRQGDRMFGRGRDGTSDPEYASRFIFRCYRTQGGNISATFWSKVTAGADILAINNSVVLNLSQSVMQFETGESAEISFGRDGIYSLFLFSVNGTGSATYTSKSKVALFDIEGQISLTPCRLLRPIPAALDANGIARNADECGMYNSVNGLFYGNVASSGGTFTVSDN